MTLKSDHPAFIFGLFALIGTSFAFSFHWILLFPFIALIAIKRAHVLGILVTLFFFAFASYMRPHVEAEGTGKGRFCIQTLKTHASPFNKSYAYCGAFISFNGVKTNLPCTLFFPMKGSRPLADSDYLIHGKWVDGQFKVDKGKPWEPIAKTFSLAESRFQAKEKLRSYLKKHLKDKRVASFLSTLSTGDVDERMLSYEFSRLGLQHLLAISGFHFGLLALFLNWAFRPFFGPKTATLLLLICLTSYYAFLGNAPSIQRAWIALAISLMGSLTQRRCTALNALGVGLIIELLLEPRVVQNMGFHLSFTATLSILLLYPFCNQFLMRWLPSRSLKVLPNMSMLHQHGYLLSAFVRKALALNLSVHLMTLPIVLFLFSKFPILSLIYNLFFPFCVGISLFLLLFSLPLPFLHSVNNAYTSWLLEISSNPPAELNYYLYAPKFTLTVLIAVMTVFVIGGIILNKKGDRRDSNPRHLEPQSNALTN